MSISVSLRASVCTRVSVFVGIKYTHSLSHTHQMPLRFSCHGQMDARTHMRICVRGISALERQCCVCSQSLASSMHLQRLATHLFIHHDKSGRTKIASAEYLFELSVVSASLIGIGAIQVQPHGAFGCESCARAPAHPRRTCTISTICGADTRTRPTIFSCVCIARIDAFRIDARTVIYIIVSFWFDELRATFSAG